MPLNHIDYMKKAIREAERAREIGEVPVGAVVVDPEGRIVSTAHNRSIMLSDATAHAEILALRDASAKMRNYRLLGTTLYVTVEPCVMCMGAVIHARVSTLVYGAMDPKWGAAGSLYHFAADTRFNHRPIVIGGVCEETCRMMIQDFFQQKR